jgi:hypothetical protein
MYARYGSYQHPANEANLEHIDYKCRYSTRLRKLTTIITMRIGGELLPSASTQAAIDAAIDQLQTAYSIDGFNFGFFTDADVLTNHRMISTDPSCVCPVRVISRSFPKGEPAEFATKRTYSIVLQAEFLTPESNLVEAHETIEYFGNAGPRWEVVETYEGPIRQLVNQRTSQKIVQSGRLVALRTHILPPGPLLPAYEHQDLRYVKLGSGRVVGRMPLFYPTEYTYVHVVPSYTEVFPTTR